MRRLAVLFVSLLTLILATCAHAQGWQVEKITQPVEYTLDSKTWNFLQPGMEVPNRSWIKTGARGRLILRRQAEMIQFKPNTVASITGEVEAGVRKTRIRQKAGSILLDVETRPTKHTSVETPFLAAVVKGTRFSVDVGRTKATLRVERGVVETTDVARGERVNVQAGQKVTVDAAARDPLKVTGRGPKAAVVKVAPTAPAVKPALSSREAAAAGLEPVLKAGTSVVASQKNEIVVKSQETASRRSDHPHEVSQIPAVDLRDTDEGNDRLMQSIEALVTTVVTMGRPDGSTNSVSHSDNAVEESRSAVVVERAEPDPSTRDERLAAREARISEQVHTRVEQRMASSGRSWTEARVSRVETRIRARIENRVAEQQETRRAERRLSRTTERHEARRAERQSQRAERRNARIEERQAERARRDPSDESAASGSLDGGSELAGSNDPSQPADAQGPAPEPAPGTGEPGGTDLPIEPDRPQEPDTHRPEHEVQQEREAERQGDREARREERKEEQQEKREERKEQRQEEREERKEQERADRAAERQAEDSAQENASGAEAGAPEDGASSGTAGEAGGTGGGGEAGASEDGASSGTAGEAGGTGGGGEAGAPEDGASSGTAGEAGGTGGGGEAGAPEDGASSGTEGTAGGTGGG